jgi:hypothetical protein
MSISEYILSTGSYLLGPIDYMGSHLKYSIVYNFLKILVNCHNFSNLIVNVKQFILIFSM